MTTLNYLLDHPKLNERINSLGRPLEVPVLPDLYVKLRDLINSPTGNSQKASELISKDPSLVMKVIKTVNSPAYGLRQNVNKLDQAVTLLGFNEISNLVLAATVLKQFPVRPGDRLLNLKKFWEHSIGVAVMTRVLMKHSRKIIGTTAEEAFISGLIHDVGKLILYQSFPTEFTQAMGFCRSEQMSLVDAEERVFGFTHQDIGAYVADSWGFSRNMVKAIELHNTPYMLDSSDDSFVFVSLIHIANILAHFQGFGNSGDPFLPAFHFNCCDALDLNVAELESILERGKDSFDQINGVMNVG
jgi:HD-like signal output (HDOD) protein